MSMVASTVKDFISIKIKSRHDSIPDQYNRIFMVKMCLICSAIISVNYFNDEVSCIIANAKGMGGDFVGSTCWIQGFYVFKEMRERLDESGYYGVPKNMDYDGINNQGQLCTVKDRAADDVHGCEPMEKLYYLQYQYMPFFTASLAILFYFPYVVFKVTNTDLLSLKDTLKRTDLTTQDILDSFFNHRVNNQKRMRYRVGMNIVVKILYLVANIMAFISCDKLLNGDFKNYGIDFTNWAKLDNQEMHDHNLKIREVPKPGNVLLPPMGFCDVHEASRDVRNTHINTHKFICEISPHILYQYVMLVLWFLLIIGMLVSAIGLLNVLFGQLVSVFCFMTERDAAKEMYKKMTMREIDYLEYIRRKDLARYGEILKKLRDNRTQTRKPMDNNNPYNPTLNAPYTDFKTPL